MRHGRHNYRTDYVVGDRVLVEWPCMQPNQWVPGVVKNIRVETILGKTHTIYSVQCEYCSIGITARYMRLKGKRKRANAS